MLSSLCFLPKKRYLLDIINYERETKKIYLILSFLTIRWSYGIVLYEISTVGKYLIHFNGNVLWVRCALHWIHRTNVISLIRATYKHWKIVEWMLQMDIPFFLEGGSPYPRIEGRKIANLLQQGYRMPKPEHVQNDLWVLSYHTLLILLRNMPSWYLD